MSEIEIEGLTVVDGIQKIQDCFLFQYLSFEETRLVASLCKPLEASPGAVIVEEGSPGEGLYLIVDGEAEVVQGEGEEGRRMLVRMRDGELFGEMSLVEDVLVSASVVARSRTKLLRIGKRDLERLMDENARLSAKIYRSFCVVLSERLRRENEKCARLEKLARI